MLARMFSDLCASTSRISIVVGIGSLTLLVLLTTAGLPVLAQPSGDVLPPCPILMLGNPTPGDTVPTGHYIVSGSAFTPGAGESSSGISHVDFFLGDRDAGGPIVGSAVTGTGTQGSTSFQSIVYIPAVSEQRFTAYAYASDSSAVTSVTVPVHIGPVTKVTSASPTVESVTVTASGGCSTSITGTQASATSQAPAVPAVAIQPVQGPVLLLGNPNAGDVVSHGSYDVYGVAFDPSASQNSGIDRVEFFLDNRDFGGQFLGNAIPGVGNPEQPRVFRGSVVFPTNASGAHNLVAYAHARSTNLESTVAVPIFVGAAPTATPQTSR
jgi:hypothetical protein